MARRWILALALAVLIAAGLLVGGIGLATRWEAPKDSRCASGSVSATSALPTRNETMILVEGHAFVVQPLGSGEFMVRMNATAPFSRIDGAGRLLPMGPAATGTSYGFGGCPAHAERFVARGNGTLVVDYWEQAPS